MQGPEPVQSVGALARSGDPDRYLSALFAPASAREALVALCAFNVELARIGESSTDPMLGDIRLQWWRDALRAGAAGERTGHPVADALAAAMRAHGLPEPALTGLIDARAFDVSGTAMPDMQALKAYLGKTAGSLFRLAAQVLGGLPLQANVAARDAGLAFGLTGLMRSFAVHRARGRLYLPATVFTDAGLDVDAVLTGPDGGRIGMAFAVLRDEARLALARARRELGQVAVGARAAWLPLALVEPYLRAVERRGPDAVRQVAEISPLDRLWRITWAALSGRI